MRAAATAVLASALVACAAPPPAASNVRPNVVPEIIVVDEHHGAVRPLLVARTTGKLREPVTLVHVDAHADLGVPTLGFRLGRAADETPAEHLARVGPRLAEMNVDEVLVPAAYLGLVDEVTWIVPDWLDEAPRDERYDVGSEGGLGRRLGLQDALDEIVHPDLRPLTVRVRKLDGTRAPRAPWVLGIDLDFFDCRNPHSEHVDREVPPDRARRRLEEARRNGWIVDRGGVGRGVGSVESTLYRLPGEALPRRLDRIEEDGLVRWVAGWQCMGGANLPVHVATPAEVRRVLERLEARLRTWPAPALVIVARSRGSGFAGPEPAEGAVLEMLRRVHASR